jgi:prolyl-tRNA synthetase
MHRAYTRIFERCGLDFAPVEADSGTIGGSLSHEFQVLADTGEDALATCSHCTYAANLEKAQIRAVAVPERQVLGSPSRLATPGVGTIEDVSAFLGKEPSELIKTLVFEADGTPVMALVRGDRELAEAKLRTHLGADDLRPAAPETLLAELGASAGSLGPVGAEMRVIADPEVLAMEAAICGANEADTHLEGVCAQRDFDAEQADIRTAVRGDGCVRCEPGALRFQRGIEVGHIFYLGTKYSSVMGASVLDPNGKATALEMGCYGIGIGRTAAACIEQNHDENGICWPVPLAPFEVHLLALGKQSEVLDACEPLYNALLARGIEVLYDDRKERPGFKFKDADLIGLPWRIGIGKRALESGTAEVVERANGERTELPISELVEFLAQRIEPARTPFSQ